MPQEPKGERDDSRCRLLAFEPFQRVPGHGNAQLTLADRLSGVPQLDASIWGDDAEAFRPERWIDAPAHEEKKRRGAMIPFGGGKHLCPGRMFAWTELIAVVGALALAFDVEGARLPPGIEPPIPGAGMRRPLWDGGKEPTLRISRREGWDDVQLGFAV